MFSARMAAAVSSTRGTSPNAAAPPVTVENAVKSTSAETTVKTEERVHHHAQVRTLTDTLWLVLSTFISIATSATLSVSSP